MAETDTTEGPPKPDEIFDSLKDHCSDNLAFFREDATESGRRILGIFRSLDDLILPLAEVYKDIAGRCPDYDFDPAVPGNGYRSFIKMVDLIVKRCTKYCGKIAATRSSYFFRKGSLERELDACWQVISALTSCMFLLKKLMSWDEGGSLFPKDHHSPEELLNEDHALINQCGFYGRCVGFQFCDSIGIVVKALATFMAYYSEVYYGGNRVIDSLWNGGRYFLDPELRAKRIVNLSQYASADFCKTFWFLGETELMHKLPNIVCPSLAVNKLITIEPEPLSITGDKGIIIHIPPPTAHNGPGPVVGRLLSSSKRLGMDEANGKEGIKMQSKGLIIHCHGGGFVAQSSRSHETYLRQWALTSDCPIFSIDYSLAPEAPYPRAVEEVFFAYCWAISNPHVLGSTAERVIMAGDSAGANLNIAITIKCIEYGVRPPDGLFLAYVPTLLSFVPSPSRLLCLADPILPFGFVMNCSRAYVSSPEEYSQLTAHEHKLKRRIQKSTPFFNGSKENSTNENTTKNPGLSPSGSEQPSPNLSPDGDDDLQLEEEMQKEALLPCPLEMLDFDVPKDPFFSPYYVKETILSAFPPVTIISVEMDPFLDDCVELAKRLRNVGNDVNLEILSGLCHGFLNFSMLSKEANEGSRVCINWINKMLALDEPENTHL